MNELNDIFILLTMLKLSKYVIFTSETSAGFSKVSGKTVDVDEGGGDESDALTPLSSVEVANVNPALSIASFIIPPKQT